MQNHSNVKELFNRLNNRLSNFETNSHSKDFSHADLPWDAYLDHRPIIYKIAEEAYAYNPHEVYEEAGLFEIRVSNILKDFKPVESIEMYHYQDGYSEVKTLSEQEQRMTMGIWKKELQTYLEQLQNIKNVAAIAIESLKAKKVESKQMNQQSVLINLPENFSVSQLNKNFDPQLSINQAALFLHYLKEQAILPPYSDSAIGKLAEAFFVRNQKNVTKGLTDIYSIKRNKEELTNLKRVLQKLITEIDKDLKESR